VGGRNTLERRGLAILRELALWRDEEAKRRDKPRRSVLKDEVLVEIARRCPQTGAEILALRSAPPNLGERNADALAARVKAAMATPRETWPEPETPLALDEQGAALVELLSAVVRMRALEEHLPPSLLANADDLRVLAANRARPDAYTGELFTGWRGELIGSELRAVLTGDRAVRWDERAGKLRLMPAGEDKG
jgi:ribonuclease D